MGRHHRNDDQTPTEAFYAGDLHEPRVPRRRRRWPWLLGGLVALVVVAAACSGSHTPAPSAAPSATPTVAPTIVPTTPAAAEKEQPVSDTHTYTFQASATGSLHKASIVYSLDMTTNQVTNAKLPWSKTVTGQGTPNIMGTSPATGSVMASTVFGETGSGTLTCRITDGSGNVVAENTTDVEGGSGSMASAMCTIPLG